MQFPILILIIAMPGYLTAALLKDDHPKKFNKDATRKLLALQMPNATVHQVEALIKQKANSNATKKYEGGAIHDAALWSRIDILEVLIAAGTDVNLKDKSGRSPLFYACTLKMPCVASVSAAKTMLYLLQHGAAVNDVCKENMTPLHTLFNWQYYKNKLEYEQCAEILFLYGLSPASLHMPYKSLYTDAHTPYQAALSLITQETLTHGINLEELQKTCQEEKKGFASLLQVNLMPVRDDKGRLVNTQRYLPLEIVMRIFDELTISKSLSYQDFLALLRHELKKDEDLPIKTPAKGVFSRFMAYFS